MTTELPTRRIESFASIVIDNVTLRRPSDPDTLNLGRFPGDPYARKFRAVTHDSAGTHEWFAGTIIDNDHDDGLTALLRVLNDRCVSAGHEAAGILTIQIKDSRGVWYTPI